MINRRWMVGIGATAAVAVLAAGALAAGAQQQDGGTTFLDRVAAKLGIDTPKLEQAIKDTRAEDIDQAVADGKLTQEQADELKQRLQDMPLDGPGFGGRGGFGERGFGMKFEGGPGHFRFGLFGPGLNMEEAQQKLADFLGITTDELKTEIQADGATLATVAEAHGKSRDDLKAFIRGEAQTALSQAVADGHLTQEQADTMLARLDEHIDEMIDHELFGGRGFRHGRPFPGAPLGDDGRQSEEQEFDLGAPIRTS